MQQPVWEAERLEWQHGFGPSCRRRRVGRGWVGRGCERDLSLAVTCLVQVCKLPTILAHPWFERLVGDSTSRLVSKQGFLEWWLSRRLVTAPPSKRLWEVLRPEGRHHLTYADFRPLLQVGAWWRW